MHCTEYLNILLNPDLPIQDENGRQRFKFRKLTLVTASELVLTNFKSENVWLQKWSEAAPIEFKSLLNVELVPNGFQLPRNVWVQLNRLRTGHGV